MTFLAPLLLLAAAALAVPLLLHLRRQRDTRVEAFPALRYLRSTLRERTRMVRLRRLLLLALRLLVLTLLVLAGARLVLPLAGGDQPPAGVALIVDNGLSSLSVVGEERALEAVREMAMEAVARLGVDDRVWVLATGEPWRPAPPLDREAAAARIRTMDGTAVTGDLDAAVSRARALLRTGSAEPRRILVVSLLAPGTLPSSGPPAAVEDDTPIPLLVGRPALDLPTNRGVARAQVDGGLAPRAGRPISLSVQVTGEPQGGQPFRVVVGDELVSRGVTDDRGEALVELPPQGEGWLAGRVELDPDPLRADDVRHFAAPVLPPPRVDVRGDPGRYLQAAVDLLAERERIEPGPGGISLEAGRPVPGAPSAPTLLLAPSDPADLGGVNRRLRELGVPWTLEPLADHLPPVVVDRSDPRLGLPQGLEVRRRYRLMPPSNGSDAGIEVAVLSDGTPWAILHVGGMGTAGSGAADSGSEERSPAVLLLASPADPVWSDLPTSVGMLPFVSGALDILAGGAATPDVVAGTPLALPAGTTEVEAPDGTRRAADGIGGFAETGRPGIYGFRDETGALLGTAVVNAAAPTSEPFLTPAQAAERLGSGAEGAPDRRAWVRGVTSDRRGREVWRPLLATAFLLLLMEGWVAARNDPDGPAPNAVDGNS